MSKAIDNFLIQDSRFIIRYSFFVFRFLSFVFIFLRASVVKFSKIDKAANHDESN